MIVIPLGLAVMAGAGGHVELAAQERLDPRLFDFLVEVQDAEKGAVVGDGHGGHLQFPDPVHQVGETDGPVQQTVGRVDVEVNKLSSRHGSPFPVLSLL